MVSSGGLVSDGLFQEFLLHVCQQLDVCMYIRVYTAKRAEFVYTA